MRNEPWGIPSGSKFAKFGIEEGTIIEGKYVVSGAQSPEIFHQIFDLVKQEKNS